jgi:hypothetical protein
MNALTQAQVLLWLALFSLAVAADPLKYSCEVCIRAVRRWKSAPGWHRADPSGFEIPPVCPDVGQSYAVTKGKRCIFWEKGLCQVWTAPTPQGSVDMEGVIENPYDPAFSLLQVQQRLRGHMSRKDKWCFEIAEELKGSMVLVSIMQYGCRVLMRSGLWKVVKPCPAPLACLSMMRPLELQRYCEPGTLPDSGWNTSLSFMPLVNIVAPPYSLPAVAPVLAPGSAPKPAPGPLAGPSSPNAQLPKPALSLSSTRSTFAKKRKKIVPK